MDVQKQHELVSLALEYRRNRWETAKLR
jgi:hypothetical protein